MVTAKLFLRGTSWKLRIKNSANLTGRNILFKLIISVDPDHNAWMRILMLIWVNATRLETESLFLINC